MRDFRALVRQHLAPLALPRHREIKIVEELAAQLEDACDALVGRGLSDDEAWAELQRQMPEWATIRDDLLDAEPALVRLAQPAQDTRGAAFPSRIASAARALLATGLLRDLQSGLRLLVRARGYSATAILTLAVCLGANMAIFSVVYGVLLRPLPLPGADRIVALGDVYPTVTPDDILSNTAPSYLDRLEALTALDEQALFSFWFDAIAIDGIAQELRGMRATPSLFRLLGVQPALGRAFTDAEAEIGAGPRIILSHGLWQRLYGGDPAALGRDLRLGWTGERYTIVGVMPRDFRFFDLGSDGHADAGRDGIQFWIPLGFTAAHKSDGARTRYGYYHIGRIRPGAAIEEVQAQVNALNARSFERFPQFRWAEMGMYTAVTPLQHALTRRVRPTLYLLWGAAACVLLIGALNIANLSLARSSARARDLATRLALGASRLRLTRQLLLEAVVLSGTAALLAIGIGTAMLRVLASGGLATLPNAAAVRFDATVVAATLALAALIGLLIGMVPAAMLGRLGAQSVLATGGRFGTGGRTVRLFRRGLIVAQVAASVVLLIGAVLLLTSFRNLLSVDAGFDPSRVITATMFPPPSRYANPGDVVALSTRVLDAIRSLPDVEAVGTTSNIPLSGSTSPATVQAADRRAGPGDAPVLPSVVVITPGYFEAMGTPLISGRRFLGSDTEKSAPVTIIDERLAVRLWPGVDPIGKGLYRGGSVRYTVVGVVGEVRFESLAGRTDSAGTAYFPEAQAPATGRLRWIAVRTAGDPAMILPSVRSALRTIDPDLPLSDVQTMRERVSQSLVSERLATALSSLFGVVALLLSVVGIYGVLAHLVARRRREIGIRIALGSSPRGILRLVLGEGVVLVCAGLILGLAGAVALGRTLEDQVFGVRPTDPVILGLVAATTGVVALLACVSPARRAARVDPVTVLADG
jgi:predicted permease